MKSKGKGEAYINSKYAPLRYEAARPFAQSLAMAIQKSRVDGRIYQIKNRENMSAVVSQALQSAKRFFPVFAVKKPDDYEVDSEIDNLDIFSKYCESGSNIFELSAGLANAFKCTDVSDVPLDHLRLPFNSFYLHFGYDFGVLSWIADDVEGCFVVDNKGDIIVLPVLANGFSGKESTLRIIAIDYAFVLLNSDGLIDIESEALIRRYGNSADWERRLSRVANGRLPTHFDWNFYEIDSARNFLAGMTSLVVNSILYINSIRDDVVEVWEAAAPKEILDRIANSSKVGEIKTLENNLTKSGYSRIKLVGAKFSKTGNGEAFNSTGRKMPTHFRRGHWRVQWYGERKSLSKLIFIAPVVVNPGGDPAGGHIYSVS